MQRFGEKERAEVSGSRCWPAPGLRPAHGRGPAPAFDACLHRSRVVAGRSNATVVSPARGGLTVDLDRPWCRRAWSEALLALLRRRVCQARHASYLPPMIAHSPLPVHSLCLYFWLATHYSDANALPAAGRPRLRPCGPARSPSTPTLASSQPWPPPTPQPLGPRR